MLLPVRNDYTRSKTVAISAITKTITNAFLLVIFLMKFFMMITSRMFFLPLFISGVSFDVFIITGMKPAHHRMCLQSSYSFVRI